MKNKVIIIETALLVAAILAGMLFFSSLRRAKEERDRYKRNVETLTSEIDTFRTRNGNLVAKVDELSLSSKEFKEMYEKEASLVKELRKRNENLSHFIDTELESHYEIKTIVRDSLIVLHDTTYLAKVFDWDDGWDAVHAKIANDSVLVNVAHRDALNIAVMTEWKRFLGFLWKTKMKGYSVAVESENPHTVSIDVSSFNIN